MGLYIPNAKIPVICNKCYEIGLAHRLRDLGGHCPRMDLHYSPDEQDFKGDRRVDCPLIEIPPHGRLGDLDRLEQMFVDIDNAPYSGFDGTEPFYSAEDAAQIIRLAPTIIPAEEVKES